MNDIVKVIILRIVIFAIVFGIFWLLSHFVFKDLDTFYKVVFSVCLTGLFSPRVKTLQTQSGRRIQLSWIFIGKTITI